MVQPHSGSLPIFVVVVFCFLFFLFFLFFMMEIKLNLNLKSRINNIFKHMIEYYSDYIQILLL